MTRFTRFVLIAAISSLLYPAGMVAQITLPSLLSDGMIVQRGQKVHLWGKAAPGESVSAKSNAKKVKPVTVTANEEGNWNLSLDAFPPGGPYEIAINDIVIRDVLCGDVFLCSGQSNMELPVQRVTDMFADEIASYQNTSIRQFLVPQVTSFHGPLEETAPSSWKECTANNVMEFSALAYFFAKQLYDMTKVPVGIINASWGGTPVEAWISQNSMEQWPEKVAEKQMYEDDGYRGRIKQVEGENYWHWNKQLYKDDSGMKQGSEWYHAGYDDSEWPETDLINGRWGMDTERPVSRPVNGSHWLRKHINLTSAQASGDAVLRMGCIEGADSAYVNGVFVGTVGYQYPPRIYPVPDGLLKEGDNVITVRVISGGGEPKCVPEKPYMLITADGEKISLEGHWKHRTGARMPQGPSMVFWHYTPIVLYDAMIAPLFKYPVEAVVWYQGESNVANRELYYDMLNTMISDWRNGYERGDVPFYIVELADYLPFEDKGGRSAWQEMREQQARVCADDTNATLIHNSDLGEWNDIHPLDKKTLGIRVAKAVTNDMKNK